MWLQESFTFLKNVLINFVLREQMAGAEWGRMYLPPPPYSSLLNTQLMQTPGYLISGFLRLKKVDFQIDCIR